MGLTIAQMASMSRLLDEALPLDAAARRVWLERLSPEYLDLAQQMREALLPEDSQAVGSKLPLTPSKFASALAASPATATSLQAGARVGPYELIRPVGSGGMAEVWLARRGDGAFKREVALKLPKLTHLRIYLEQRFARERDILASLEHPHIARFYDAGIDPHGLPYVAMEYVQGQPLTIWFEAHCLQIPARLELFLQVLAAVQYAHENHVIHRDLKPSNILVTESGQVRLLDFGVAKLLEADEEQLTQLTNVYGRALTPDYASPELLRGDSVDARSDIYSLGVLLYETLTGVRPYQLTSAASMGMIEQAIAGVDISKPSTRRQEVEIAGRGNTPEKLIRQLRGDLDAIALKALAKAPAARYASAAALAEDLRSYLDGKPIKALPARFTDRLGKFVRRNRTVVGVSAAAVAAVLAMIGYTLHRETVAAGKIAANAVAVSSPRRASSLATTNLMAPVAFTAAESSIAVGNTPLATPAASVAVVPFVNLTGEPAKEYFSDGIAEELISELSQVPDLKVPARTSSFAYKGRNIDVRRIARDLGVATVLEGSVRASGDHIRVTAQMVNAENGYHVWSQTYDREFGDLFKLEDELARQIVMALKDSMHAELSAGVTLRPPTSDAEAYRFYLQSESAASTRAALRLNARALARDPKFARAIAWNAVLRLDSLATGEPLPGALADGEREVRAALALEPNLAVAQSALGSIYATQGNWLQAEGAYHEGLRLGGNDSSIHLCYAIYVPFSSGHLAQGLEETKTAYRLAPASRGIVVALAIQYSLIGRDKEALSYADLADQIGGAPEDYWLGRVRAIADLRRGHYDTALKHMKRMLTSLPFALQSPSGIQALRLAFAALGNEGDKIAAAHNLTAFAQRVRSDQLDDLTLKDVILWDVMLGDIDSAYDFASRALDQRALTGSVGTWWAVLWTPEMRSFRQDPRFQAFVGRLKLFDYWKRYGPPDGCELRDAELVCP